MANVTNAVVGTVVNPHEPPGRAAGRRQLSFRKSCISPRRGRTATIWSIVEIYNSNPWFQDISGYQITCADMNYTFPPNTNIPGGGYLVIAAAPADIQSVYGITNVHGTLHRQPEKIRDAAVAG